MRLLAFALIVTSSGCMDVPTAEELTLEDELVQERRYAVVPDGTRAVGRTSPEPEPDPELEAVEQTSPRSGKPRIVVTRYDASRIDDEYGAADGTALCPFDVRAEGLPRSTPAVRPSPPSWPRSSARRTVKTRS